MLAYVRGMGAAAVPANHNFACAKLFAVTADVACVIAWDVGLLCRGDSSNGNGRGRRMRERPQEASRAVIGGEGGWSTRSREAAETTGRSGRHHVAARVGRSAIAMSNGSGAPSG